MEKFKRILQYCGVCIAFYIGAGFATMQEVMQYEASYGSKFWMVIAVCAVIYVYTNLSFISNGNRLHVKNNGDIYKAYCGKYIGKFFDYFSSLICYMSFVVMCGGANSTAIEQWGLPNGAGALILTLLVVGTAIFGLKGIIKALGILGPIIILSIDTVAGFTAYNGWGNFQEGLYAVDNHLYNIPQIGGGNFVASGASYGGFVILWFAAFLSSIGAKHNPHEVRLGMALSTLAIFGVAVLCCIALIANIKITWNVGVPALALAKTIHPILAQIFAIIIFIGIFTSACPLLWTGVRKLSEEGTAIYKLLTIVCGIVGCLIACFVPYQPLLNILYGLNGYLGFILVAFMILNDIRVFIKNRHAR